ncbi:cellulase family glycosylhydrolase [uncultured Nevskia sp.]|uniref:cellulase family glycosylhydrolase n=1 Tax=uncultured Nevskia sp. TaxID=228950 RepID=UPI0025E62A4A|nr:cellulase family glycosylhydrolase [uncultured Nevskia sp.]
MKTIRSLLAPCGLQFLMVVSLLISPMANAAGYFTQGGKLYDPAGQEFQVRGISHYGFNADILQPQFLWAMGWKEQIAQIKALGFNAVRLPFVPDTLYNTTPVDQLSYVDPGRNPELLGKTPLQVMDLWMAEADRQGLYVMLDFHSVSKQRQYPTWFVSNPADYALIYNNRAYTADDWRRDLAFVASRYANLSHFFAIDVYNEPNGIVRWSTGDANAADPVNFWKPAVESAATAVLNANPNLLIFVQGITGNYDSIENSNVPVNWGENFQPQAYQPLNIPLAKLVLSPHTYGPDVYVKSSFAASNFPNNLKADWDTLFGQFSAVHPVVIGEWGGRYGQGGVGAADVAWQNALVDYLQGKGIRNSFYWCYTPNSGDTGGILDDQLQVRQDKLALLQRHWAGASSTPAPTPTPVPTSGATLALSASEYAVAQSVGALTVKLSRSGNASAVVTVRGYTADGSAKAGSDYVARSGVLRWAAGDTSTRSIIINVKKTPFSGTRNFTINLADATGGATLGAISSATVTITGSKAVTPSPTPPPTPTPAPTAFPQQTISSFSPASGPVGTVVTINGAGFTGSNAAWAGNAHNAGLSVISDTQVRVTIPAGATSGALAILNPAHAAFTASAFTVR